MLSLQGRRMLPPASPPGGRQMKDGMVFAVGQRALLACATDGRGRVTLTDESGTAAVVTLSAGTEVAIVAWRPRRGGGTRYRVAVSSDGTEGWVGVASLAPRPVAPPAARPVVASPVRAAKPAPAPARTPARAGLTAKPRPAVAASKPKRKSR